MTASTGRGTDGAAAASPARSIVVGIATRGRPHVLAATLDHLRRQTLAPTLVVVAGTSPDDVGALQERPGLLIVTERPGLTRQRNAILRHVPQGTDMVVFFDDDFIPHPGWLAAAAQALDRHPEAASITGHVIRDGIKGAGIPFEEGLASVMTEHGPPSGPGAEPCSPYGCNMAFRRTALEGRWFDERLVLYGWLEDRDFGGRLARDGWALLKIAAARGVHMGAKSGRTAGVRLGYSQVVNPLYLLRKGTMSAAQTADHVLRNLAANLWGSLRPEPFIDRRGRLRGNALAVLDLCRGRLTPERAASL